MHRQIVKPEEARAGWRGLLTGNVLWLSVASFLNDVSSEMIFPLLPVFLVSTLGAGPVFLGLVEGVAETTASFVKLAGGWASDRLRRRRVLVTWGYGIAAATRPLMAFAGRPWHVLGIRFADRIGKGVRTAPRDALLSDSVPEAARGRAFGFHRAADHAGAVLGPLLAAGLLLAWPGRLRRVFLLAAIPAVVAAVAIVLRVREVLPAVPHTPAASTPDEVPASGAAAIEATVGGGAPETPPATAAASETPPATGILPALGGGFVAYLAVLVLFTLGNASDAFLLLRARSLGVAVAMIPVLWGAFHVSKMVWNVVGGSLADRIGPVPGILAGWLVYAATYAGFARAGNAWQVWTLFGVYGLFYGLTEPTEKALVAALAPAPARARAFGAYHFAIGIAALPASVLFGAVWETFGPAAAFYLGAILALGAALLLPFAVARAKGLAP